MEKQIKNKLPCDIIEEILYKLPVKSLLRFKCVSKSWRSLISGRYFIKQHLKKLRTNNDTDSTDLTNQNELITFRYYRDLFFSLGSCSLHDAPIFTGTSSDYPKPGLVRIVGSCNGLILVTAYKPYDLLLLWNPSTREVKKILPPEEEAQAKGQTSMHSWINLHRFRLGFGYDEATDDYKVVCFKVTSYRERSYETQMYSSKDDSWKKLPDFDMGFIEHYPAKFVNGSFHWLPATTRNDHRECGIVSLDLVEEKYQIVAPPRCLLSNFDDISMLKLVDLGGYLGILSVTREGDGDIWAMMEYGKSESWVRVWTYSDFVDDPVERFVITAKPLSLKKNGDIAVAIGLDVLVCNGKNLLGKSRVDMLIDYGGVEPLVYVESLVSPFGDDDDQ